jgi:hypothetical protein
MFELYKDVGIDLSHLVGLTKLSDDYEVIDSGNQYEHRSVINVESNSYKFNYLSNDKVLVEFDDSYYFMKLRYENAPETQGQYDVIVENLNQNEIEFKNDNKTTNFKSLTQGELLYGREYIKESINDSNIGEESDILMNILQSEHEYMINMIVEGQHLMYIGTKITNEQIL